MKNVRNEVECCIFALCMTLTIRQLGEVMMVIIPPFMIFTHFLNDTAKCDFAYTQKLTCRIDSLIVDESELPFISLKVVQDFLEGVNCVLFWFWPRPVGLILKAVGRGDISNVYLTPIPPVNGSSDSLFFCSHPKRFCSIPPMRMRSIWVGKHHESILLYRVIHEVLYHSVTLSIESCK